MADVPGSHDVEQDGIVYPAVPDNIPANLDHDAMYQVTIKSSFEGPGGIAYRPEQSILMRGDLVEQHRSEISVARPA